jgi:hypothetical protein
MDSKFNETDKDDYDDSTPVAQGEKSKARAILTIKSFDSDEQPNLMKKVVEEKSPREDMALDYMSDDKDGKERQSEMQKTLS